MPNPPVDPSLEERVARALEEGDPWPHPDPWQGVAHAALAALTTDDLKTLYEARSDEVVVTLTREEAEIVRWLIKEYEHSDNRQGGNQHNTSRRLLASFRSKLSTALESE